MERPKFIAINLGASQSAHNRHQLLELAKQVCEKFMNENYKSSQNLGPISSSSPAPKTLTTEDAAVTLVRLMEKNQKLNCGLGSNLTLSGHVECDASIMSDRQGIWSGVGAVSGCKSPVVLAKSLYDHAHVPRPLGLVQPNFLVGSGARQWMREHCPELAVADSKLIAGRCFKKYQKLKSSYDLASKQQTPTLPQQASPSAQVTSSRLDTVGAVVLGHDGHLACAISSGGIMLKQKGRVGQAAVPGAGCWAENGVGVTTTGVGEYLTTTLFAKNVFDELNRLQNSSSVSEDSVTAEVEKCINSLVKHPALAHVSPQERSSGLISLILTKETTDPNLYFSFGHNTKSMCIGYMTNQDSEARSVESVLSEGQHIKVSTIKIPT